MCNLYKTMLRCAETHLIIPEIVCFVTSEPTLPFCDVINRRPFRISEHLIWQNRQRKPYYHEYKRNWKHR